MMFANLLFLVSAFGAIWFGAGLIIRSVDRIARRLRLSRFAISFFLLGILTSIPEIAISATAVADRRPEIFVGTLLGGIVVIFLLIIPFLAILGNGIRINHDLDQHHLIITLAVIAAPAYLVIDHRVTNTEGLYLIILYLILFILIQSRHGIFDQGPEKVMALKVYSFLDIVRVAAGLVMVFLSSQYIVSQTIAFSQWYQISSFYVSLIALSIGTNLPELSLAIRAIFAGKKDIAFGDYLGSAAANTLIFGLFTIINEGEVLTTNNFLITFGFIVLGLFCFYLFSQSQRRISRSEGAILFGIYILFVVFELVKMVFR